MSCQPEQVTGYVDGVLDAEALAKVESHVANCAACAAQAGFERDLRLRLRSLPAPEPRAGFEEQVRRRLRAAPSRRAWWLLPLAAGLALLAFWGRSNGAFVAWELSRDHAHCFGLRKLPAEVWSGDPAQVATWFEAHGTRLPTVPAGAGDLELVGGRHCPLPDLTRVAHLYYVSGGRHVSVFVVPHAVRFRETYARRVRGNDVRLLRIAGAHVGIVGEHAEDVEAFRRAFVTTVAWRPGPGDLLPPAAKRSRIDQAPGAR